MKESVAPLGIKVPRITNRMFIIRQKGVQKSSRNILLCGVTYDDMYQRTILPVHNIMKDESNIWKQNKVRLGKAQNEGGSRMNPNLSSGFYMTAVKEAECKFVAEIVANKTRCAWKT